MQQPTSHFIGISLNDSKKWCFLFQKIEKLLGNNFEDIISFQNPDTIHITLYYLLKNITHKELFFIKNYLKQINTIGTIKIQNFNIFYKGNDPFIYFINPITSIDIIRINNELKMNLISMKTIYENTLGPVPI